MAADPLEATGRTMPARSPVAPSVSAVNPVAAVGGNLKDYRAALLAGYAWDSTLQKLKG